MCVRGLALAPLGRAVAGLSSFAPACLVGRLAASSMFAAQGPLPPGLGWRIFGHGFDFVKCEFRFNFTSAPFSVPKHFHFSHLQQNAT